MSQEIKLAFVIAVAVTLALVNLYSKYEGIGYKAFLGSGAALIAVGVIGHMLLGRDVEQLIVLEDTNGIGRTYVAGLCLILAALLHSILKGIKKTQLWKSK